ncbi:hypothetical protein SSP24_71770 [Streptomyces spinoverrucosus]|uniref:Uncharacterized protein n=2 Tax=Streptomyces spinoverrucosus TaxID=284043 RepID=A0A4Y3VR76_9ACTN|nr:hypothetical protein SSP24_71770 [Streptomyces spinoverrucosus]GHB73551.1 hypothetical protein GCM10010397_49750 [Streptomyces spinoverrucosus]
MTSGDAIQRMAEALADVPEADRIEALRGLGAKEREQAPRPERRTPLPAPRQDSGIVSAVEWV